MLTIKTLIVTEIEGLLLKPRQPEHVSHGMLTVATPTKTLPKMAPSNTTTLQYQAYPKPVNTPCVTCMLLFPHLTWGPCVPRANSFPLYLDVPLQSFHCVSE